MHAFGPRISAYFSPDALGHRGIPGCGQTDPAGHGRGWPIVAHADWSIRHFQSRQTESGDAADIKAVDASEHVDLFFKRHFAEE